MELATLEKTLFAFDPISRTVPTTITRITASITAYSAISCPSWSRHNLKRWFIVTASPKQINFCTNPQKQTKGRWASGTDASSITTLRGDYSKS